MAWVLLLALRRFRREAMAMIYHPPTHKIRIIRTYHSDARRSEAEPASAAKERNEAHGKVNLEANAQKP